MFDKIFSCFHKSKPSHIERELTGSVCSLSDLNEIIYNIGVKAGYSAGYKAGAIGRKDTTHG